MNQEFPRYLCHKEVRAVQISRIVYLPFNDGGANLMPSDSDKYDPIAVSEVWLQKHCPEPGGYYVVYKDGYTSYSPAEAFEEGYTRIEK